MSRSVENGAIAGSKSGQLSDDKNMGAEVVNEICPFVQTCEQENQTQSNRFRESGGLCGRIALTLLTDSKLYSAPKNGKGDVRITNSQPSSLGAMNVWLSLSYMNSLITSEPLGVREV